MQHQDTNAHHVDLEHMLFPLHHVALVQQEHTQQQLHPPPVLVALLATNQKLLELHLLQFAMHVQQAIIQELELLNAMPVPLAIIPDPVLHPAQVAHLGIIHNTGLPLRALHVAQELIRDRQPQAVLLVPRIPIRSIRDQLGAQDVLSSVILDLELLIAQIFLAPVTEFRRS